VSALEGSLSVQTGTQRVNVTGRMMAVDSSGATAYLLTASGLSIIPLSVVNSFNGPRVNNKGVVNIANYTTDLAPGSIASVFGRGLASSATAAATPLPALLGGVCVTIGDVPAPLLLTSDTLINLHVPPDLAAGQHTLVVRAIDQHVAGQPAILTLAKFAPAVYTDPSTGYATIFHSDGKPVSKSSPAHRDEPLVLYAEGLGVTTGGKVTAGNPAPSSPPAVTGKVQVFFGDPGYKQAEVIVDWSGLVPGRIGLYQINLRVPGFHMKGDALPVTLRIGGVNSKPGTPPAIVAVD